MNEEYYKTRCVVLEKKLDRVIDGYITLGDKIKELQQIIEKALEYIENYDVFKEFSFPLMKRDEENQIKSSIKYEFDTSIKKNLLQILKGEER